MTMPLVSVLIDTYNHESFVEQAIMSVLEQEVPRAEMEVLVVDDGSTDGTPALVRKFVPRVRCLRKSNGGQASAFNTGIPETRGEIVAFLDGDDWWAKDKLRLVLEGFEKNPGVGVVGHGIFEVDTEAGRQSSLLPGESRLLSFDTLESALPFRYLRCFFGTSRVAIRKSVLDRVLPIPEALVVEADEFMSTASAAVSGALLLEQPLTYYRFHPGNLFQFQNGDRGRVRRKADVMACLVRELPPRLAALGVSEKVIARLVEPVWVEAERLRLALDGGKPWDTFRVERADFRLAYCDASRGYHFFKRLVLGLTLVLPPRCFYRLRQWYTAKGLRRFRRLVGEPVSAAPILKQQEIRCQR